MLLQYYQFLRLGREGFTEVQQTSRQIAQQLAAEIGAMEPFELWNDGSDIPVFAWRLKEDHQASWTLYDLSDRLRMFGWQVPSYPLPADLEQITVQRIVVRSGFSKDMALDFLADLRSQVAFLESQSEDRQTRHTPASDASRCTFHH